MANKSFKQALFLPVVAVIGGYLALVVSDLLPAPHFFVPETCYEVTSTVHNSGETYDHHYCFKNWAFVCHIAHENRTDNLLSNSGYADKTCSEKAIDFIAKIGFGGTSKNSFSIKEGGNKIEGNFEMIGVDGKTTSTGTISGTRIKD